MNKVIAEIIAGVIPQKMERNRWRGILRYGLFNAIRLVCRLKHDHTQPDCYLAVCAIAKDEGPYFKEWIDWHLSKGVEKFYIYDNGSTDGTKEILEPYIGAGTVEYTYFPGHRWPPMTTALKNTALTPAGSLLSIWMSSSSR